MRQVYVVGSGTDVGKTYFSAAFCSAFSFGYLKLIQAGAPGDSKTVRDLAPQTRIEPSLVSLQAAASPHIGRKLEGLDYKALDLALPRIDKLLIEMAGGVLSPLDEESTVLDYIVKNPRPLIVVSRYYLGSINHTLLTLKALEGLRILAVVMMGDGEYKDEIEGFIESKTSAPLIRLDFYDKSRMHEAKDRLIAKLSSHVKACFKNLDYTDAS